MREIVTLGIGIAVVVALLLAWYYVRTYRGNRALGSPGLISRVRLVCPKCHQTFDYDFVPGASVTALRLGTSRYMACPLCHKWSTFDMTGNRLPATPHAGP